jgi:hypothetical protein
VRDELRGPQCEDEKAKEVLKGIVLEIYLK